MKQRSRNIQELELSRRKEAGEVVRVKKREVGREEGRMGKEVGEGKTFKNCTISFNQLLSIFLERNLNFFTQNDTFSQAFY